MDNYQIIWKFINDLKVISEYVNGQGFRGMSIVDIPEGYSPIASVVGDTEVMFSPLHPMVDQGLRGNSVLHINGNNHLICIKNEHMDHLRTHIIKYKMGFSIFADELNDIPDLLKVFKINLETSPSIYKGSPSKMKEKIASMNMDHYKNILLERKGFAVPVKETSVETSIIDIVEEVPTTAIIDDLPW